METFASIQVTIDGDTATRDVLGYDQMRIVRDDVTHVQDFDDGSVVMTTDPERWLGVPNGLLDYQEVRVAQAIIASSRQVLLAADHTKFGRNALVRLGDVEEIDALYTDAAPPEPLRRRLEVGEVALHVAPAEGDDERSG